MHQRLKLDDGLRHRSPVHYCSEVETLYACAAAWPALPRGRAQQSNAGRASIFSVLATMFLGDSRLILDIDNEERADEPTLYGLFQFAALPFD